MTGRPLPGTDAMKISVIVTTYNRPEALAAVLEGLRLQTVPPDEVIVADDGSGPETAETVRKAAGRMPWPLSHVWQEDRGFRAAAIRNRAILASTGSYIVLLDGDCIPDRHFVGDHRDAGGTGLFFPGEARPGGKRDGRAVHRKPGQFRAAAPLFLQGD